MASANTSHARSGIWLTLKRMKPAARCAGLISWSLVLSLPVMGCPMIATWPADFADITGQAWLSLGYVSVFSMLIGFIFWYRGLTLGGIAGVGQLQLLQPFFGLALARLLLGAPVPMTMVGQPLFVVLCVAGAKRFA